MLPRAPVALLLIIRIRSGLLLILVWITRGLSQNIGRGFNLFCRGWSDAERNCEASKFTWFLFMFTFTCPALQSPSGVTGNTPLCLLPK